MSMLLGLDLDGQLGVLISDRSATRDNRSWDADIPKLAKVGSGFVAASGDATTTAVFLAAAQSAAYAQRKRSLDSADILGIAQRVLGLFPTNESWEQVRCMRLGFVAMTERGRVTSLVDGAVVRGSRMFMPSRSPAQELTAALCSELVDAGSVCDLVRIAAAFVAEVHEADPRVGLTMDFAACLSHGQAGYLSGSARELSVSTDRMIMAKVAGATPDYFLKLTSSAIPVDAVEVDDTGIEEGAVEVASA